MNGLLDVQTMEFFQEPLRLSDEQLRIELGRNHVKSNRYFKSTNRHRIIGSIDIHHFDGQRIREGLELIFQAKLDPEFWSALYGTIFELHVGCNRHSFSMMLNLVLTHLLGRHPYQDLDSTFHIPLYCMANSYNMFVWYTHRTLSEYRLEWNETDFPSPSPSPNGNIFEYELTLDEGKWGPGIETMNCVMILIRFKEPTQLDRVVLQPEDEPSTVFEGDRIFSVEFMGYQIYGICPDPRFETWKHLAE